MRLLTKNTLSYLLVTLVVFLAGGFIFYFHLKKIFNEESNENLYQKKNELVSYIRESGHLPACDIPGQLVTFEQTTVAQPTRLFDTIIYNQSEEELLPYRYLSFTEKSGNTLYRISVGKSMIEDEDLLETIIISFLIITVILIAALLIFNLIASRLILKPFFRTLELARKYDVETQAPLNLQKTGTLEFTELNCALNDMTQRVSSSYRNLKAFSENASHELQTPLAVIKTKTELLIQRISGEDNLSELRIINQTASRAARLNQTLLLLSKIENHQFPAAGVINFSAIVKDKLTHYEELFRMKDIALIYKTEEVKITMNPELGEIVISNLLTNALKYTQQWGTVEVELTSRSLCVRNTGAPLQSSAAQLFQRFHKENSSSDSTGLGLSIVFEIAKVSAHRVSYIYKENMHQFVYSFYN